MGWGSGGGGRKRDRDRERARPSEVHPNLVGKSCSFLDSDPSKGHEPYDCQDQDTDTNSRLRFAQTTAHFLVRSRIISDGKGSSG